MVNLPDPGRPVPAAWEIELASMILQHPGSILVGHSLGAVLIVRLLATWPHLRLRGALLVAPAETTENDRIGHFGAIPELRMDVPTTVVASRNDPWMSFGRAARLARAWGSNLVDMGHAGQVAFFEWGRFSSHRYVRRNKCQNQSFDPPCPEDPVPAIVLSAPKPDREPPMSNDPPIIDIEREKRRRAYDALWPILASDPILQDDRNFPDAECIFSPSYRRLAGAWTPTRRLGRWAEAPGGVSGRSNRQIAFAADITMGLERN